MCSSPVPPPAQPTVATAPGDCIKVLESNKKEMFEGMRAYHVSEREHKRDAMAIFAATLTTFGAVFAGVVAKEPKHPICVMAIASAIVLFVIWRTAVSTLRKIDADHNSYATYGSEYVRTSAQLDKLLPDDFRLNKPTNVGQGRGYVATKRILIELAIVAGISVVAASLLFAFGF